MTFSVKSLLKKIVLYLPLQRLYKFYAIEKRLFEYLITHLDSGYVREVLFLPESSHSTQLNQDIFAILSSGQKPGYFLEIGANNGYNLSNTLYLETHMGWDGLLVEANPRFQASLGTRKAKHEIVAISKEVGLIDFLDADLYGGIKSTIDLSHSKHTNDCKIISVKTDTLESILDRHSCPNIIDFVSIDVEGAEIEIVKQIVASSRYRFACGCIEYNYRSESLTKMVSLLSTAQYKPVWSQSDGHDLFFVDNSYPAS